MSIIIRLQNLPWAADSMDIRRYFTGLSIPEGGVHIVGGEMGDAFIAFSTDEDARLAMEKDGGKIHEMQIKLLLSSRTEMMRVIEKARQQNMALQAQVLPMQPPPMPMMPIQQPVRSTPTSTESERRRARSPTPPRRRSRDKSPQRDRRRSPDSRRSSSSKRDRSRSPARNSRGSGSRDTDRRGDRFKRDERRYEEAPRYRDDRQDNRSSSRDATQDTRKYSDGNNYNRQSRIAPVESFHNSPSNQGYYESPAAVTPTLGSYNSEAPRTSYDAPYASYDVSRTSANSKDYPVSFYNNSSNGKTSFPSSDSNALDKPNVLRLANETSATTNNFTSQQAPYETSYVQSAPLDKRSHSDALPQPSLDKGRRRTRFEPEFVPPPDTQSGYTPTAPARAGYPANADARSRYAPTPDTRPEYAPPSDTRPNFAPPSDARPSYATPPDARPSYATPPDARPSYATPANARPGYTSPPPDARASRAPPPDTRPGYAPPSEVPFNPPKASQQPITSQSPQETQYGDKRNFQASTRNSWPLQPEENRKSSSRWTNKPQTLIDSPVSKDKDFVQVVPMDIEPSTPPQETNAFNLPDQYLNPINTAPFIPKSSMSPRKEEMGGDVTSRAPVMQSNRQWHGPTSTTVEINGFPSDVRSKELIGLFPNIFIEPANLCIQTNKQGAEKAFVRFNNTIEFEKALSIKFGYIRNYRCNIIPCPAAAFEAAIQSLKQEKPIPKPREEDLVIQMRGLPYSCTKSDVAHFFDGLQIVNIFLEMGADGRASGVGFVEMASTKDFRMGLTMNNKMIAHRYITLTIASKDHIANSKGLDRAPPTIRSKSPPSLGILNNNVEPPFPTHRPKDPVVKPPVNQGPVELNPVRSPNCCIALRGLANNVQNEDIVDFFANLNIVIRAIHLLLDENKIPSGDAFVEVPDKRDQEAALSKDGKLMLGMCVSVTPISFQEMAGILDGSSGPLLPPPALGPPLLQTPPNSERPRRPLIPQVPGEVHFRERGPPDMDVDRPGNEMYDNDHRHLDRPHLNRPHNDRPYPDHPHDDRLHPDRDDGYYEHPHADRPRQDFPHGERLRPSFHRGERPHPGARPRMEPPMRGMRPPMERGDGPPFGRMRGPLSGRPRGPGGPPPRDHGGPPADFGAPGCIVSINNLHFHAKLEDLFDFFKEYRYLTKNSIIRKFNERGQTTSEACVAFANPRDAQRVVKELNMKTIMGRSLSLSLL